MCSSDLTDELQTGKLVNVLPAYINRHPYLSIVYMPERFRPANVRRLIEHALEYFQDPGRRVGA